MDVAETERRINQLYNDVHAIYDQLTVIQRTQQAHGGQLASHGRQLEAHGNQLDAQGRQLEAQGRQLASLNDTVTRIWAGQQEHGERLNHLDSAVAVLTEKVGALDQRFEEHDARFDEQGRKLDLIIEALNIRPN
jgi:chromosome segregation ATPase